MGAPRSLHAHVRASDPLSPAPSRDRGGPGGQRQEQPLPGRRQGLQPERQLQEAALLLHLHLQPRDLARRALQPPQVPQGPAPVLRPRAQRVHLPHALLLLPGPGVRRAPPADHPAQLLLRGQGEAQLPGPAQRVPHRPPVPVRAPRGSPAEARPSRHPLGRRDSSPEPSKEGALDMCRMNSPSFLRSLVHSSFKTGLFAFSVPSLVLSSEGKPR